MLIILISIKKISGGFDYECDKNRKVYIKKNILAAIIIAGGTWEKRITDFENPKVYAWWGTIYPEFCFEKVEDNGENKPVKISFWLAKALDW